MDDLQKIIDIWEYIKKNEDKLISQGMKDLIASTLKHLKNLLALKGVNDGTNVN